MTFCAEYDALPQIGHGCGHNLIAVSSIAAFLGAVAAMKESFSPGRVQLLGCPAEEGGGGKLKLIEAGGFCVFFCFVYFSLLFDDYFNPFVLNNKKSSNLHFVCSIVVCFCVCVCILGANQSGPPDFPRNCLARDSRTTRK